MEFQNLEELKQLFLSGRFNFPSEIVVDGVKYKANLAPQSYSMEDIIKKGYKSMWTYFTNFRERSKSVGLDHALVFLWGFLQNSNTMVPWDLRTSTKARLSSPITEKTDNGDTVNIPKDRIVGDVVTMMVTSIPGSKPMQAKIDSGADVSSMHADSWNINNGQVTFMCPELSENKISMPVIEKQAIKISNGDMEYRPVIELNIKINDQQLTNCMFNLNDRGKMTYPVLIGQNVLEAGGFMIDPSIDDPNDPNVTLEDIEVDWEALQEEFKDIERVV